MKLSISVTEAESLSSLRAQRELNRYRRRVYRRIRRAARRGLRQAEARSHRLDLVNEAVISELREKGFDAWGSSFMTRIRISWKGDNPYQH